MTEKMLAWPSLDVGVLTAGYRTQAASKKREAPGGSDPSERRGLPESAWEETCFQWVGLQRRSVVRTKKWLEKLLREPE